MAAGDTAGAGSGQVGRVGITAQHHVGCAKYFSTVGVGGGVAKEAVETGNGGGCRGGLF